MLNTKKYIYILVVCLIIISLALGCGIHGDRALETNNPTGSTSVLGSDKALSEVTVTAEKQKTTTSSNQSHTIGTYQSENDITRPSLSRNSSATSGSKTQAKKAFVTAGKKASVSAASTSTSVPSKSSPVGSALPRRIVAGYYTGWSAYSGFTPDKVKASVLDVVHYAFAGIGSDNKISVEDPHIDYKNFSSLKTVKKNNPHLYTSISVGGWGNSYGFSDMSLTASTRNTFAQSCVEFIKKYGFDGVDIDWEYPVSGGAAGRPEDRANFTLLMKTLREYLDSQGLKDGRYYYLSFAGGASKGFVGNVQLAQLSSYVDYAVNMTYDLHGPWDKYADFNAPLYTPQEASPQYKISVASSIKYWLDAGFPANKLVMGIPFYGYTYDITDSQGNGLYSRFTGAEAVGYDSIVSLYLKNGNKFFHTGAQVPYLQSGGKFISYDDAASITKKAEYAVDKGLRGVSAWELGYDKTSVLLTAAHNII